MKQAGGTSLARFLAFILSLAIPSLGQSQPIDLKEAINAEGLDLYQHLRILPQDMHLTRSFSEVQAFENSDFQKLERIISFDHTQKWLKLLVTNDSHSPEPIIITSQFPVLAVNLYHVDDRGIHQAKMGTGGPQDIKYPLAAAKLEIQPGQSEIYFEIHTGQSPLVLDFSLWGQDQFNSHVTSYYTFLGLVFGSLGSLLAYNFFLLFFVRTKPYLYYVCYFGSILIFLSITSGAVSIITRSATFMNGWFIWLASALGFVTLFTIHFLELNSAKYRWSKRFLQSFAAMCLVFPLSFPLMPNLSANVYLSIGSIAIVVMMTAGFRRIFDGFTPAIFYSLSFVLISTSSLVFAFYALGFIEYDQRIILGQPLAATLECILLSMALGSLMSQTKEEHETFKNSLQGIVSKNLMDAVFENRFRIEQKPTYQNVTIMFIDIVGYSLSSRSLVPKRAFESLKECLVRINDIILSHGGVIDKSLGDGVLCFFGYDLIGNTDDRHPEKAHKCAVEIQRSSVRRILESKESSDDVVYPLRIGMNTATICIGNMGDGKRFDFTMSGDGVILASRYEAACEPFKIIMGSATFNNLSREIKNEIGFNQRYVPIKHEPDLNMAYEFDPFFDQFDLLAEANQIYWEHRHERQKFRRFSIGKRFLVTSKYADLVVLNYSLNGLCLRSSKYFGKGSTLKIELPESGTHPEINTLSPIMITIAWGRCDLKQESEPFIHGAKIEGINSKQKEMLFEFFAAWDQEVPAAS